MFAAFTFQQKSIKSHNLLRKILNTSQENEQENAVATIQTERRSQSTQTKSVDNEEEEEEEVTIVETIDEFGIKEMKPILVDELIEDDSNGNDDDSNETWHMIYLSNAENGDPIIEPDVKHCEMIDIDCESVNDPLEQSFDTIDCCHCGELISRSHLNTHLHEHAKLFQYILTSSEFFRCSRCLRVYPDMDTLIEHTNAAEPCKYSSELKKDDTCTDYQYLVSDPPIRLFSTSKTVDSSLYSCSLCASSFEDVLSFFIHFEEEHLSKLDISTEYMHSELTHLCGICGKSFKNLQDALHHVYYHQIGYPCPHNGCWEINDSFSTLYNHFNRKHNEDEIQCSHCSFVAANNLELRRHERVSCTARRFKCDICGKSKETLWCSNGTVF